jgi:hypothetical protein
MKKLALIVVVALIIGCNSGNSVMSPTESFTTESIVSATLTYPSNGATNVNRIIKGHNVKKCNIFGIWDCHNVWVVDSDSGYRFTWSGVPGAAQYEIEIAETPSFNSGDQCTNNLLWLRQIVPYYYCGCLGKNRKYYWRVWSYPGLEPTSIPTQSATYTFTTGNN